MITLIQHCQWCVLILTMGTKTMSVRCPLTHSYTCTICTEWCLSSHPDSKVHGANMGSTWGRQDPGGPHVGPMNLAIWDASWKWFNLCNHAVMCLNWGGGEDWCQYGLIYHSSSVHYSMFIGLYDLLMDSCDRDDTTVCMFLLNEWYDKITYHKTPVYLF